MPTAFPFRLLVLTLLAAAISAQQTEESLRGPAVGEVSDRSGGPWAGVEVVLVSRPLPHNPNVGEVDRVVATADARGRFHAEILRGRPYSAWAWGEAADDGRSATAVAERVFVQRPVVLREQRRLPRRTLVLDQMDRWKICRGFVVRVVDQTDNRLVQWLEVKDGKAVLPFLVGTDAFVEVFADLGERRCPLARQRVEASDPAGDLHVALPERQHVTCWVRDAGSEKPRAGATVFRRLGGALYPAGVTDADGKLLLDIAKVESPSPEFSTLVLADQQMFGICQRVGSNHFPPKPSLPEGAGAEDLFANLRDGGTLHARIVGLDGQPLAGVEVWCAGMASNSPSPSSAAWDNWERAVTTDERGEFAIGGIRTESQPTAHLLLRERDYAALPKSWRPGLLPVVFAPLVGQHGTGTAEDPIIADLRPMCPIELDFAEAGGAPAEDVELCLACLAHWVETPWSLNAGDALADPRGRLRILVPGGEHLGFRAVRGMAMLIRGFETSAGRSDAGPAVARFELPPPTGIRGQLLDATGASGSDRTVFASFGTNNQPAEWRFVSQDASLLTDAKRNALRVLLPEDVHERLMLTVLISRQVATDRDGLFAVPLPLDPVPGMVMFTGKVGTRAFFESKQLPWTGESQEDVVWKLR